MPDVGLLLAESEAVKAKFSTLYVPDPKQPDNRRRVKVWYGNPSGERERAYPFITIDFIDIRFGAERAHSLDQVAVDWWPAEGSTFQEYADLRDIDVDPDAPYGTTIRFQPYDLYYQVSTHTRTALQDMHLTSQMLSTEYAPLSQIGTLHVPADGTQRWLDNEGWSRADYRDAEEKTVFRKIYMLKISAHMAVGDPAAYARVLEVAATIHGTADGEQYAAWVHSDA